jgi:hypothetical protein
MGKQRILVTIANSTHTKAVLSCCSGLLACKLASNVSAALLVDKERKQAKTAACTAVTTESFFSLNFSSSVSRI